MSNLNIAIFGSSGAIGRSLCLEYAKSKNTNKVFNQLYIHISIFSQKHK